MAGTSTGTTPAGRLRPGMSVVVRVTPRGAAMIRPILDHKEYDMANSNSQADPDTLARNLAAARRFVEGVLGGADPAAFEEVVAEHVTVDTGLKPVGKIEGREEYGRVLGETLGAAFSNGRMDIKDIAPLADGRVIVRFEASADNTGPLNGIAATNRRFTFCELHLMRFEDGRLVENWVGGLNPLMYEMWQAPAVAPKLLGETP